MIKTIALVLAVVAGLWLLARSKVGAVVAPSLGVTAKENAEAILSNPTLALANHQAYVAAHPSSSEIIDQYNTHLLQGTASTGDVIRAETDLAVYDQYVKDGGQKTYEQFIIWDYNTMPAIYKNQIDAANLRALEVYVDGCMEGFSSPANLQEYMDKLSPGGKVHTEIEKRILAGETVLEPEVYVAVKEAEKATTEVTQTYSAEVIEAGKVTTVEALDKLAEEAGRESAAYEEAIDAAFEAVAVAAKESGGFVAWSAEEGYHGVTAAEAETYIF